MNRKSPLVVVVFGSPGSGKSETVAELAKLLNCAAIAEPTARLVSSGLLARLCVGDAVGYETQMLMMAERAASYWEAGARVGELVVLDGHLSLDVLIFPEVHARRGVLSDDDGERLVLAYDRAVLDVPAWANDVFLYVYLRPGAAESHRRSSELRRRVEERALRPLDFELFERACDACAKQLYDDDERLLVLDTSAMSVDAVAARVAEELL